MPEPNVSIVVGSAAPPEALDACLAALESQRDSAEVLVCEARESAIELRERYPWASFRVVPGALVPELWRDGIDQASGRIVALTIAQMIPAPDWVGSIVEQHRRYDVVGGAIDPGPNLRVADWAEYFCRYARDMRPFAGHACLDLPGDNAAYKRELLEERRDLYRDGFWEPVVHRSLAAAGVELWHAPELVVNQGRSAGIAAFVRQRWRHGRAHGGQQGLGRRRRANLVRALGAPLVPAVLTLRTLREVRQRRRALGPLLAALPLIVTFNVVWAAGEALGYLDAIRGR